MDNISPLFAALLAKGPVRADGFTYYLYGNTLRKCKSKRGPKKTRSAGEKKGVDRFTEARKMWKVYRLAVGDLAIWRIMARETGVSKSDSLFHSTNGGCFRPGKGVWAFPTFRFSVGTLDTPLITGIERDGWKITIQWTNDENPSKTYLAQRVFVGYFYDTLPRSPLLIRNIHACRGDGSVTLEIPPAGQPDGTPLHLYLFFGDEELNHFSPSGYAGA